MLPSFFSVVLILSVSVLHTRAARAFDNNATTDADFEEILLKSHKSKDSDAVKKLFWLEDDGSTTSHMGWLNPVEYNALHELYNVTKGSGWTCHHQQGVPWNFPAVPDYAAPCRDHWWGVLCTCYDANGPAPVDKDFEMYSYYDYHAAFLGGKSGTRFSNEGVNCTVTKLNLNDCNMVGEWKTSLKLANLTSLNIRANKKLVGTITPYVSGTPKLEVLDFGRNKLVGNLDILNSLTELAYLDGTSNRFIGTLPKFPNSDKMVICILSYNQLTGTIPDYSHWKVVKSFQVESNKLTGNVDNVFLMTTLFWLDVRRNQLSGPIPPIPTGSNLAVLDVSYNNLNGTVPKNFAPHIFAMDLNCNLLTGEIPEDIGTFQTLVMLVLENNQLTGQIPSGLGDLPLIQYISLGRTPADPARPACSRPERNSFVGKIPAALCDKSTIQVIKMPPVSVDNPQICYPSCLHGVFSAEFVNSAYRCQGQEDAALCSFIASTNVAQAVQNNEATTSINLESPHPINRGHKLDSHKVSVRNARGYELNFFPKTIFPTVQICDDMAASLASPDENFGMFNRMSRHCVDSLMYICIKLPCYFAHAIHTVSGVAPSIVRVDSPEFYISYQHSFPYLLPPLFGYQITITAFLSSFGWSCGPPPNPLFADAAFFKKSGAYGSSSVKVSSIANEKPLQSVFRKQAFEVSAVSATVIENNDLPVYERSYANNLCLFNTTQDWQGVECVVGQPAKIDLRGYGIVGRISREFFKLNAVDFDLSKNNLNGSLDIDEKVPLDRIRNLQLQFNYLSGEVPAGLTALSSAAAVNLHGNQLRGELPHALSVLSATSSVEVDLTNNAISGQIPTTYCAFGTSTLSKLHLSGNIIDCYQPCADETAISVYSSTFRLCTPTSSPTSEPTSEPTVGVDNSADEISWLLIVYVFGSVVLVLLVLLLVVWLQRHFHAAREKRVENMERMKQLLVLPIHSALLESTTDYPISTIEIQKLIRSYHHTLCRRDYDQQTAVTIAIKNNLSHDIIFELVKASLPVRPSKGWTKNVSDPGVPDGETVRIDMSMTRSESDSVFRSDLGRSVDASYDEMDVYSSDGSSRPDEALVLFDVVDPVDHGYSWTKVIGPLDTYADVVERILEESPELAEGLAHSTDETGREALALAGRPRIKLAIDRSLLFYRRYDFSASNPSHQSETCVMFMAKDLDSTDTPQVALKLMKNRDQFKREISIRDQGHFDPRCVIHVICSFNAEEDPTFEKHLCRFGLQDYRYCIVMPAGDHDLEHIIGREQIAGKDWSMIRTFTEQLAEAVEAMHRLGIVHGDIKPLNIVRKGYRLCLIDLDASTSVVGGFMGMKYSSAYAPPELVFEQHVDEHDMSFNRGNDFLYLIKSFTADEDSNAPIPGELRPYDLLKADPSFDAWSLGMVLYKLFSGKPFFLSDGADNIGQASLERLFKYEDTFRRSQLEEIYNVQARNLVSQLLVKDPQRRPSMAQILHHPFITTKNSIRMIGEEPEFDVFISYRVASDVDHATELYHLLKAAGLKVWFDKFCLELGKRWDEGFCEGLMKSRTFVPLLSRKAINNPDNERFNITKFTEASPCDNVLLEHQLALELRQRGLIELICPILIGDQQSVTATSATYTHYFAAGCHPNLDKLRSTVMRSNDDKLSSELERMGLGSALLGHMPIATIIESLLLNQGLFLEADKTAAFTHIVKSIADENKKAADHKLLLAVKQQKFANPTPWISASSRKDDQLASNKVSTTSAASKATSHTQSSAAKHSLHPFGHRKVHPVNN